MATESPLSDEMPNGQRRVIVAVLAVGLLCAILYWLNIQITVIASDETVPREWRQHAEIIKSVLENLIAGAIAAILLALTFKWIIAFVDPKDRVIEISPNNITSRLLHNALRTRSYVFMGNTATFVSAAVLPVLSDSIRVSGIPRSVKLILIDPLDESAIKRYSEFKFRAMQTASKVGDQHLARWVPPITTPRGESSDEISAKALAAIYLCAFSSLQSGMEVSIFLRRSFTPFRADMTNTEVVLTQESANESAVAFPAQGHFYGWYHKEAEAQCMQATEIDVAGERNQLSHLGLAHPSSPREEIKKSLIALVGHFSHLKKLAENQTVIDNAAEKISRPSHAYQA